MLTAILLIWLIPAAGLSTYNAIDCNLDHSNRITTSECVIGGTVASIAWPIIVTAAGVAKLNEDKIRF